MVHVEAGRRLPLLFDLYAATVAALLGVRNAGDVTLGLMVAARTEAERLAARSRPHGWLLRQFREGTISWALVALLVLVTAGLMGLFSSLSRA